MISDKQFKELSEKLEVLIKITAISALKERTLTDQVEILSAIGLQPKEIAAILGTDPATVSVLKSRVKKRKTKTETLKDESKQKKEREDT